MAPWTSGKINLFRPGDQHSDMADRDKPVKQPSDGNVDVFLRKLAMTPNVRAAADSGRLIFAMDATASREPTWDHACHIQSQMFTETAKLGGLSIQLCYYRGINEFSHFTWQHSSAELLKSMTSVFCLGGHTQIEKVLQHAIEQNRQRKVDALVFIGDAMEEDVDRLCQLGGELGLAGVPAFIFQEGDDPIAAHAFQSIARLSNGAYCRFDAGSARQLRELLSAVAVYVAGGRKALDDFSQGKPAVVRQLVRQLTRQ